MRRLSGTVFAALAATVLLSVGGADASKTAKTYLGCGKDAGEDNFCIIGSGWGATFEAKNGKRTKYELCVKTPAGKDCAKHKTNRNGKDFTPLFNKPNETPGTVKATWKVGGKFAGRDSMTLGIGD